MSMTRVCPNCFQSEGLRFFFNDREKEAEFHREKGWCECGYESQEEMMRDQDLGFTDPRWVLIIRAFLNEYYKSLGKGVIQNKDEHVRYFLKLLKFSANNYRMSIELISRSEIIKYIIDGEPIKKPRSNIFDYASDLSDLPKKVALEVLNEKILDSNNKLKQEVIKLKRTGIIKSCIIAGLLVGLICIVLF